MDISKAGHLPTADELLQEAAGVSGNRFSPADGQVRNPIPLQPLLRRCAHIVQKAVALVVIERHGAGHVLVGLRHASGLADLLGEQVGNSASVLLDGLMLKITGLRSTGSNNDVFAKYVGHEVQVKGAKSPGPKATFIVTGVVQIADICGQSK